MTCFTFASLKTQYDASGDIVWRKDSEVSVRYVQALGVTWAETRVSGSGSATFWHHTDHEGTSEVITDSSGSIVWEASYEAYGAVIRTNATMSFTPSYTGKEFDSDIGLYYFNARWYDPDLGRFITEDPARDGVNWFAYCNENPVKYIDPTGLEIMKLTSNEKMQNGFGYLGSTSFEIRKTSCVVTAWINIINTINGNSTLRVNSFGTNRVYDGSELRTITQENTNYIDEKGCLKIDQLVQENTAGWEFGRSKSYLKQTVEALDEFNGPAFVTGSAELADGHGNHTVNIVGKENKQEVLQSQGTSNSDDNSVPKRQYSTSKYSEDDNISKLHKIDYIVPSNQKKEFDSILKDKIQKYKTHEEQKASVFRGKDENK